MTSLPLRIFNFKLLKWRYVRPVFSSILIVSACLKWRDFGTPNALYDVAPSLDLALIQAQILLALWLLTGWKPLFAWICTFSLFATFAGAALAMVLQKRASCGCFGTVELNPVWALYFDLASISILLLATEVKDRRGTDLTTERTLGPRSKRFVLNFGLGIALLAVSIGFSLVYFNNQFGSFYARVVPIALSGQVLVTEPPIVQASPGVAGEWRTLSFTVVNRGLEPVRLIGAEQNCKCRAIESLPVAVPAKGQVNILVDVKLGSKSTFALLTSDKRQARLVCRWHAVN